MPNFTGKSGGGPSTMKMYGKGKNPITMSKNPVMMLGDLDKDGKMSGYESKRQAAIEENTKKSPNRKYALGQAAAIYAQKADDAKKKKNK